MDDETRVARAFDAGYVLLLDSAEENGLAKPADHPSASVIRAGSRALGVAAPDAREGLRLLKWVDWRRYAEPGSAPCAPDAAISWAERIRLLYVARRHRIRSPGA